MNSIWFVNICWLRIRISLFGPNYSNTIRIPNYLLTSDMCDISLRLLDLLSVKFKWVYLQVGPKIPSAGALKTVERHFAKDMKAGKKHAMQHPLQFRAIHVNNCFLFQWKCTARQGKQYFLPIKREKLDRQASDRLSKDKTQINLFLGKQALFMIYGGEMTSNCISRSVLLIFQHLL